MDKQNKFLQISMGPVHILMVVMLIGGAYLLGRLTKEVEVLRNGVGGTGTALGAQAGVPQAAPEVPQTADNVPKPTKDDWVKGNRNAKIALIEYSDTECPFCKRFHPTAQQVVDTYKDQVMWVYRHYPLSFHKNAQKQAEAAECAGKLAGNDAFWKYIDAIYDRTEAGGTGFALDNLVPLAVEQGLNEARFAECLDSGEMAQKVKDQMDAGTQAGVTGTPGNILLNTETGKTRLLPGAVPFETVKAAIDELLAS